MANENAVSVVHSYSDDNGVSLPNFGVIDFLSSSSLKEPIENVQAIGTIEESVTLNIDGVAAAGGLFICKNLDSTNFVKFNPGMSISIVKLLPGEVCVLRWGSDVTTVSATADTAEVKIWYRYIPV